MSNRNPDQNKTRPSADHLPARHKLLPVDSEQGEKQSGILPPQPNGLLRRVGLEHHHSRQHAAGGVLQVSGYSVFLRNLQACLQEGASWGRLRAR